MKAFTVGAGVCVLLLGATAGCGSQSKASSTANSTGSTALPSASAAALKPTTSQGTLFSAAQVQAGLLRPAQMGTDFDIDGYAPSPTPSVKWQCADTGDDSGGGLVPVPSGGTGFQEGFSEESTDPNAFQQFIVSQIAVVYPDAATASAAADKIATATASCTTGTKYVPFKFSPGNGMSTTWNLAKSSTAGWRIWHDTQHWKDDTSSHNVGVTMADLAVKDNVVMVIEVDGSGTQDRPGSDDLASPVFSKVYSSMNAAQTHPATAPTAYDPLGPVPITSPPAPAPGLPKMASSQQLCARVPGAKVASIMKVAATTPRPDDSGGTTDLVCDYAGVTVAVSVRVSYGQFADLREADQLAKALKTKRTFPGLGQGAYWDTDPPLLFVRVGNDCLKVSAVSRASGAAAPALAAAIAKLELGG